MKTFNDYYFKPKAIDIYLEMVQEKTKLPFLLDLSLDEMLLQLHIAEANLKEAIKMTQSLKEDYDD